MYKPYMPTTEDSVHDSFGKQMTVPLSAHSQRILLIADHAAERGQQIEAWISAANYRTLTTTDSANALALIRTGRPDLVVIDSCLPSESWFDVCRILRKSESKTMPLLVLLEERPNVDWGGVHTALEGHDPDAINEFVIWPCARELFLAKIRTTLRISTLQHELRVSNSMLKELTQYLNNMVESKVSELENMNRLRRFFSPQIVEAIVSENADEVLKEHRSEITVVFLDLREFTPFAESHSPQEVFQLVREFHQAVGPTIFRHGGTLERFTGDGLMVFLGDPKPMPDHAFEAIRMSLHIQHMVNKKKRQWARAGYRLGLGIGVSTGEATLGTIGFEHRYDYAAIGTVTNMAARLCALAESEQILISEQTYEKSRDRISATNRGAIQLKGFSKPSVVYSVEGLTTDPFSADEPR